MHMTDLGGYSGCKVLLCETGENIVFVRKISGNVEYNGRLQLQAAKQAGFKGKTMKAPAVLGQGYTEEGLFYFDMEYIQGITMAEYIKTIEIGKVRGFIEIIVNDVLALRDGSQADEMIFTDKIDSLRDGFADRNIPVITEALELLSKHSWKNFTRSMCHGDLTLENIIVKDNQVYLIDFLDSFYDCWIMDIGTLMQDVQTLWSYRSQKEISNNTLIRLIVFRDILMDMVKERSADICIEVYYALLLKLIRIYPYTKDDGTFCFLKEKTQSVIDIIKREEGSCVL